MATTTTDRPLDRAVEAAPQPARPETRPRDPMALPANEMPAAATEAPCDLRRRMERLVDLDGAAVHRIGGARTSVRFRVGGDASASFVLLADRRPPTVVDVEEPAEIELRLSVDQASRFADGDLIIPIEILTTGVEYDGPVRKYLDIDPILRAMLSPEERS